MTGEPVASNCLTVSRTAASYAAAREGSSPPMRVAASISEAGRGMLPIGSVGIFMSRIGTFVFR